MNLSPPPFVVKKKPVPESLSSQLERAMVAGAKRVLFVDDDWEFRQLVMRAARGYNVELIEADTSGRAKDMISAETFDAAILDVRVTNGDGIALYGWIMENYPKMTVIFLTGAELETISDKVHAVGSAPVYFKPNFLTTAFIEDLLQKLGARPRQQA